MTIRQFMTVLVSNILYRHHMTIFQWLGATTVFLALFYKSVAKAVVKSSPKGDTTPAQK